jgi:hypothetical protein
MLSKWMSGAALAVAAGWGVPVVAQDVGVAPVAAVEAVDAMPVAPALVPASFVAPGRDAGGYRTPNRDLTPEETSWHVRVALNVAALGCRGADEAAITAGYNAVLGTQRAALAQAAAGTEQVYRARAGAEWQGRQDDDMTRLYNFWAQPPAQESFCAVAATLLREAADLPPDGFAAFAAAALPRLEAPFTRFYAAWDGYKDALAAWQARHASGLVIATSAPTPVALGHPLEVEGAGTAAAAVEAAAPVVLAAAEPATTRHLGPGEP